jgi:uroporphyrinogen-III synthase
MTETVVVTASAGSFPGLVAALATFPVTVEERPLMHFAPPVDRAPFDAALDRITQYRALVLTSPRAAEYLAARVQERRMTWAGEQRGLTIWAAGRQTAAALAGVLGPVRLPLGDHGRRLGSAKALARGMLAEKVIGPVLFPCGETHRDELPSELRRNGIAVDEVVCYRSILAKESEARVAASRGSVVVVASPRVAGLLARACPREARPELLAVGPTTAESARAAGWSPSAVASEPTARALASAVRSLLANR